MPHKPEEIVCDTCGDTFPSMDAWDDHVFQTTVLTHAETLLGDVDRRFKPWLERQVFDIDVADFPADGEVMDSDGLTTALRVIGRNQGMSNPRADPDELTGALIQQYGEVMAAQLSVDGFDINRYLSRDVDADAEAVARAIIDFHVELAKQDISGTVHTVEDLYETLEESQSFCGVSLESINQRVDSAEDWHQSRLKDALYSLGIEYDGIGWECETTNTAAETFRRLNSRAPDIVQSANTSRFAVDLDG